MVEAVWRIESARLTAALARTVNDLASAEDLAQDALIAALEQWPRTGVPDKPSAWLWAVARRRAVDTVRRRANLERKLALLAHETPDGEDPIDALEFDRHVDDDVLRLMFTACHPLIGRDARVALTLKTVAGLSTDEIARAFLVPSSTLGQRISRAKKTLSTSGIAFEVPVGDELTARLASVLEVVYLVFNEGYAATSGDSWTRADLCAEAMRLGRMLAALAPDEPEPHALVALMEFQASRLRARTAADGSPVPLDRQDRTRWDRLLITHAEGAMRRAEHLGGRGSYLLQAALAACHARAVNAEATDWPRIAELYRELSARTGSPVVELNRAVAVSMAESPTAALSIVDELSEVSALRDYHLLPAVRGDLLLKLERRDEARAEFQRAAAMTGNEVERTLLLDRAASCRTESTEHVRAQ
ncbi:RNA polymerase sigma factor [Nocardia bovistercoris]|uniref:RNA polymerase sigma factor n=1 Tax=Nocardia bovistercoris TaxID=2785916 RepID=A0A931IIN4_9NOCA|nr:RNA polymerase sigma factor [Nocardia bovistercoris]MBH0780707.1 RNA polymerase sigma factor [Nocardia bovistercoris]